jgi:mono/diheme cytochrome c family protein
MERNAMSHWRICIMLAYAPLVTANAEAQESGPSPGRNMVMSKCFQCHTDAMFRDQRQDLRAWEAAIYRMVGRGGLWSQEEIKVMAEYLGSEFGPNSKPAVQSK